jgi:hypothetical protein
MTPGMTAGRATSARNPPRGELATPGDVAALLTWQASPAACLPGGLREREYPAPVPGTRPAPPASSPAGHRHPRPPAVLPGTMPQVSSRPARIALIRARRAAAGPRPLRRDGPQAPDDRRAAPAPLARRWPAAAAGGAVTLLRRPPGTG